MGQDRQRFYWSEERVNEELDAIIVDQFESFVEAYEERTLTSLRTAAYVVALQRVMNVGEQRGTWP